MKKMTIGGKIALTSTVLVGCTMLLAAASLLSVGRLSDRIHSLQVDSIPGQYLSGRLDSTAAEWRESMTAEVFDLTTNNAKDAAKRRADLAEDEKVLRTQLAEYEKTITQEEDRQNFVKITPALERCIQAFQKVRLAGRDHSKLLKIYHSEALPALEALNQVLETIVDWNQESAKANAKVGAAAAATAQWWSWVMAIGSVLIGSLLSYFVVRGINRALRRAVRELSEGAEQTASAAGQVASASQSLAQGSSEQAASLEETSASSEEINSMARKNSENSRTAADLVSSSQQKFNETNQALDQTVTAMADINAQSGKISKIIKTIDEIAFQTNILALNAAVEAARAGAAGMGFAVVADEVRNLAQRCAQAAKDTAAMIEESIVKSNDGKTKVDQVAASIRTITEESARVRTLVDEVNLGSQEQARGIDQIGKAITQMEQVTQKSAANAEEGAAAAEELNAQSETLKEVVTRLTQMVGGVQAHAKTKEPKRAREASPSLAALHKAIGHETVRPAAAAPAALKPNKNALPLEEEFTEF